MSAEKIVESWLVRNLSFGVPRCAESRFAYPVYPHKFWKVCSLLTVLCNMSTKLTLRILTKIYWVTLLPHRALLLLLTLHRSWKVCSRLNVLCKISVELTFGKFWLWGTRVRWSHLAYPMYPNEFSKVCLSRNVLCNFTTKLTFENLYPGMLGHASPTPRTAIAAEAALAALETMEV